MFSGLKLLTKFIYVGDPHCKKNNIEESVRLIKWIYETAKRLGLPVLFAGDQYDDFGIAKVECVDFWKWAFDLIEESISIVGNHDQNSDGSLNFMSVHSDQTLVIDKLTKIGNVTLMPFYRKNEKFEEALKTVTDSRFLLCHQEFNGCQYETGFFAPHGADVKVIPVNIETVISGHIHREQWFDRVWYPGTPRQLTRSDIGHQKGIYVIDLTDRKLAYEFIPTPTEVSESFVKFEVTEESQLKDIPNSSRVYVDLKGSEEFLKKMIKKVPSDVKLRTFNTTEQSIVTTAKESEGIPKAFMGYSLNYFNDKNIGTNEAKAILAKIYEKCPSLKTGV